MRKLIEKELHVPAVANVLSEHELVATHSSSFVTRMPRKGVCNAQYRWSKNKK